jgi:hypothetical protein
MFLLRSAFWLVVAFVVIAPKDVDLGARANDYTQQALAAGQRVVVSQILASDCTSFDCFGTKAFVAGVLPNIPSTDPSMQDSSNLPVPLPRPRPDWMG